MAASDGRDTGLTKRYGCKLLVWFEMHGSMETAILREKQIKGSSRQDKTAVIEEVNPEWRDFWPEIVL